MAVNRKLRKSLIWAFLALLLAGLVYAGVELAGQTNKAAADAGSTGADMEMASLDTIKQSQTNKVDWSEERRLKGKIDKADSAYRMQASKAQSEIAASGKVGDGTRSAGLSAAARFQQECNAYAAFWDKNNGKTRARLARETGMARVKNADMTFNEASSDKISAYNEQQSALTKARRAYLAEAKTDVSAADRAEIKANLLPRLNRMRGDVSNLASTIASLLNQVRGQVGGGISAGSIGGCARQVATSAPSGGMGGLLSPLTSLTSMMQSMGGNLQDLLSDINGL